MAEGEAGCPAPLSAQPPRWVPWVAVMAQVALLGLCAAGNVRLAWLVAAYSSALPVSTGALVWQVVGAWVLSALAFALLRPVGRGRAGWWAALWWTGVARAALIPVVLVASPWLLGGQMARIELDVRHFPAIGFHHITPLAYILSALQVVLITGAVGAHAAAFARLRPDTPASAWRFLVAFCAAAVLTR